jgi:NhaA family Na+:H+ antiporter
VSDGNRAGRRPLRFIRPLSDFLHTESAGGAALVLAAIVALVWANSPARDTYEDLWNTHLGISLGSHTLDMTLREWVNEGLMTLFFFVVGLEIKRELVEGELRDPRRAALPVIAAVGGMAVPAALYVAINAGTGAVGGWGIPMATDIAMALGAVTLLGSRVPAASKVFLLALAIVDDIGAIIVIAFVYSGGLHYDALLVAAVVAAGVVLARASGVRFTIAYVVLGAALWLALHESGVHATIVGAALGLMAPTRPIRQRELVDVDQLSDISTVENAYETAALARESVSVVEWLEHLLHPWSSFVVLPVFALANAGIPLGRQAIGDAASSRVTYGVLVGLVLGKVIGVTLFAWIAVRIGVGALPGGTRWVDMLGIGVFAGIGFTVSIFVAQLAFDDPAVVDQAKVGVLAASVVAGLLGALVISRASRRAAARSV